MMDFSESCSGQVSIGHFIGYTSLAYLEGKGVSVTAGDYTGALFQRLLDFVTASRQATSPHPVILQKTAWVQQRRNIVTDTVSISGKVSPHVIISSVFARKGPASPRTHFISSNQLPERRRE